MVGLVVQYGGFVAVVNAATLEQAEHIALEMFAEAGIDLDGVKVPMLVIDLSETGGLLLDGNPSTEMDGWTSDGYMPGDSGD